MPASTGDASEAELGSTEKQVPCEPGSGAAAATEIAALRSRSTESQSVKMCWKWGSLRAGSPASAAPTRTQLAVGDSGHWNSPAWVAAIATSAVPPSAPPGTATSQDPSV